MKTSNHVACLFASLSALWIAQGAYAGVISDPSGAFSVGVGPAGELYDSASGVGFSRVVDGFDPLAPGTPYDSYGVAVAGVGSAVAANGNSNDIVSTAQTFAASTATSTSVTSLGLTLAQTYTFAAPNVIQISETVTNTSGASESIMFQRDVDWDVSPTEFYENTFGPIGSASSVVDATSYGFEDPDPMIAYGASCAVSCDTTGDNGGGIKIALGTLAAGASTNFNYFYGISATGQTIDGLTTQAQALGAQYVVATQSSENGAYPAQGTNAAFIGFGLSVSAAPEPSTWALLLAGVGLIGTALRRRAAGGTPLTA